MTISKLLYIGCVKWIKYLRTGMKESDNRFSFLTDFSGFSAFVNLTEINHSRHIIAELMELLLKAIKLLFLLFMIFALSGCKVQGPFYKAGYEHDKNKYPVKENISYSLFLVGDAGDAAISSAVFSHLKKDISSMGSQSAVVNLGNNAYPVGLPDKINKRRGKAEETLDTQIETFKNYKGEVFFIPGNHDWAKGKQSGYLNLLNQERYLNERMNRQVFFPENGCPGPVEISLSDTLVLVMIDSQWFFQNHYKPLSEEDCGIEDEEDVFLQLRDILRRNKDKSIVVASHHPLYSIGTHGGRFNPWLNIFPLTVLNDNLFIPLPGFIYTAARKYFGHIQDLPHPRYKQYVESLTEVLQEFPDVVFTAGHEHNLQYAQKDDLHHIISGAASKTSEIVHNDDADFGFSALGYARLDYLNNGDVWVKFIAVEASDKPELMYSKKLFTYRMLVEALQGGSEGQVFPDSITMAPSKRYAAGKFKQFMLGENYRDVWSEPVTVRVFDISEDKGGLEIVKRGGGMQTLSVRLQADDKRQYNLRSLDKYADKTVPESLQETFAADLVQDNISATIPYGAVVAAALEEQIGLYHTNPEIVYVPDDPDLGIYREDLAGKLFLFEERPDEDWSTAGFFGYSDNLKSTSSAVEDLLDDNELEVDQPFVLKNRLFDMFINDWDRHDDQWRWAPIDEDGKTIYRPVPRDRDNALFVNQGLVPAIAKRQWAVWRLQGVNDEKPDVRGLNFNGRHFDRTFLNEMTLEDFTTVAEELQNQLTDERIEKALKSMPESVYRLRADDLRRSLQKRREQLKILATDYYKVLAKEVDILGSEDDEFFEVTRHADGKTDVKVYDIKGDEKKAKLIYSRVFHPDITNEIRLFGIDDDDHYNLTGSGKQGVKVRIIAGEEEDNIRDESFVRGWGKNTVIYDNVEDAEVFFAGKEARVINIESEEAHSYNRNDFKYGITSPAAFFGHNTEDGVFAGGGFRITRHGFRKEPFKSQHKLVANYAAKTDAFNVDYLSEFTELFGQWDFVVDGRLFGPNYTSNYFGFGNDTKLYEFDFEKNKSYNYVRREEIRINPSVRLQMDKTELSFGVFYQTSEIENNQARFITDFQNNGLSENILDRKSYAGLQGQVSFDSRNHHLFPTAGIYWNLAGQWYLGANKHSEIFNKISSDLSLYLSRKVSPRTVLALRFGGELNNGQYDFIHAAVLGGKNNLRGYPVTRFYGDAAAYQNTDLRIKLANIHSFYLSGQIGIFGFHDIGRVWAENENSSLWHNGYGGGVWFSPFGLALITAQYAMSDEYDIFRLKFNFQF